MPLIICEHTEIDKTRVQILLIFDSAFMVDRILDLFVGYYNPNGLYEHRLQHVIYQNLSSKFYMEILIIVCPVLLYQSEQNSLYYLLFKLPR